MTTSLQELIDDSIFISTEHQARLAELSQGVEWDVDFSVPSFTLQSDPPVVLTPHLLGTDSTERGSWVWSWQELGHFPSEVVAAAVQTRESGARAEVTELTTDELAAQEGLARQLTLAAKALTGVWAHYPARVGKQVTAWLLLDGPELDLEPITLEAMMRVIAEALQTGTAVDHNRALDSYAKLRGMHIAWDTDAMCVVTTRDGAQRFWFEEHQISGVEPAESEVSSEDLGRLEQEARTRREALTADRQDARRLAEEQATRDTAARDARETERRAATQDTTDTAGDAAAGTTAASAAPAAEAAAPVAPTAADTQEPLPAELSREDLEAPVPGAAAESREDLPYDQEPRRDVAPGAVTTTTVPSLAEEHGAEHGTERGAEHGEEHRGDRVDSRSPEATEEHADAAQVSSPAPATAAQETEGHEADVVPVGTGSTTGLTSEPGEALDQPEPSAGTTAATDRAAAGREPDTGMHSSDRELADAGSGQQVRDTHPLDERDAVSVEAGASESTLDHDGRATVDAERAAASTAGDKPLDPTADADATVDATADRADGHPAAETETHDSDKQPRKKGFFNRFFGL